MDGLGLLRLAGTTLLALAAFVGYFHIKSWAGAAHGNPSALPGAIGSLIICALVPLSAIMIARRQREAEFSRLEAYAGELYNMLMHGAGAFAGRDIISQMITVYAIARGVNGRIGWYLVAGLSVSILICALYVDHLAALHSFTHNQANLIVVFMLTSAFGLWCLLWPEDPKRVDQFDPSEVLASAIGR